MTLNSELRTDRKHIKYRKTKNYFPKITDKPAMKKIITTHECVKCNFVAPSSHRHAISVVI